ncbi:MFS transporter [Kribbella sp. NBC_01484]|uniref:MFS transporter n=1 Tax=Kribbella sp. NBC_01484 TaxID=2903579 RepID=UPI002E341E27|nr:MFS transporter [Kribbella sp. NBC_01484]
MTTSTVHIEHAPATGETRRGRLSRSAGFWAIAASMAILTAFSTAPSPLYGLYRRQDHLSSITITVVYAVFAAGVVTSLLLVGHVSDWYGRRTVLLPALLTGLVAALIFATSTSLPALFAGRVLTGLALGAATATAGAYLTDLDSGPNGVPTRRSQIVSTVANVGGLAVGPLAAGLLATYVPSLPRLIYFTFAALLVLALAATWRSPEVRSLPTPRPRYRPQRLAIPGTARAQFSAALTGDFLVFTVYGVFAGLASAFLSGPLHRSSPALAGLTVFIAFGVGALTQVTTATWPLRRLLALGIPVLIVGLTVIVTAAWVHPPSLAFFLTGAALVGVGSGSIFRSMLSVVISTAPPNERAAALALFFVVGYVGLSVPVVGAGIALQYVTFKVILLTFAILVAAGVLIASPLLLRLSTKN